MPLVPGQTIGTTPASQELSSKPTYAVMLPLLQEECVRSKTWYRHYEARKVSRGLSTILFALARGNCSAETARYYIMLVLALAVTAAAAPRSNLRVRIDKELRGCDGDSTSSEDGKPPSPGCQASEQLLDLASDGAAHIVLQDYIEHVAGFVVGMRQLCAFVETCLA